MTCIVTASISTKYFYIGKLIYHISTHVTKLLFLLSQCVEQLLGRAFIQDAVREKHRFFNYYLKFDFHSACIHLSLATILT